MSFIRFAIKIKQCKINTVWMVVHSALMSSELYDQLRKTKWYSNAKKFVDTICENYIKSY